MSQTAPGAVALFGLTLTAGCVTETGTSTEDSTQTGENLYLLGTPWTSGIVNVCYDGVDGNDPTLLAQAQTMLANSWSRAARISFVGWGQCNYASRTSPFSTVAVHFQAGTRGFSGFGMPASTLSGGRWNVGVNNLYLVSDDPAPQRHFTYEVIHEFGHALGWAHEQERPDNWSGNNGDGKTDVIVTTASGSYWYYSTGTGTWNPAYTRTDLPLGSVSFVPGDFNGDLKADVIITAASGSSWYYSTGTGTWNPAYSRSDLPLGSTSYAVKDFNGDSKADVIITTATGSYWYYSTGTGTWNPAYTRTDLPLGTALYTPGDFSGDGKGDVIITTASGSYWYYSTGTGTWNPAYTRTDLPL